MTLEEAIKHCEEVAERCAVTDGNLKCEMEHRQLAEWLRELKEWRLATNLQPTCNQLATDVISRQAAIDALDKRFDKIPMEQTTEILELRKDLRGLPPAQPEPLLDEIVDEVGKTIAETESNGKYHAAHVRHNGEMICHGLQIALNIIEEKRNERSD